jgi:Tfp pilus assembly protein FimV
MAKMASLHADLTSIPSEATGEPETVELKPKTYTAKDGDTYASISASKKPKRLSRHEYATHLYKINKGATVRAGLVVKL